MKTATLGGALLLLVALLASTAVEAGRPSQRAPPPHLLGPGGMHETEEGSGSGSGEEGSGSGEESTTTIMTTITTEAPVSSTSSVDAEGSGDDDEETTTARPTRPTTTTRPTRPTTTTRPTTSTTTTTTTTTKATTTKATTTKTVPTVTTVRAERTLFTIIYDIDYDRAVASPEFSNKIRVAAEAALKASPLIVKLQRGSTIVQVIAPATTVVPDGAVEAMDRQTMCVDHEGGSRCPITLAESSSSKSSSGSDAAVYIGVAVGLAAVALVVVAALAVRRRRHQTAAKEFRQDTFVSNFWMSDKGTYVGKPEVRAQLNKILFDIDGKVCDV